MTFIALVLGSLAFSQTSQPADAARNRPPGARRQGERSPPPLPPGANSPTDQDQMQVDRWVRRAKRTYQLDEAQEAMIRGALESMRVERKNAMGADAIEYDRLRNDLIQFWNDSREEGNRIPRQQWRKFREDPKLQETRRKIGDIEKKYPFDWDTSMQRCENLLPAEQVQKAHDRQEQRRQVARARRQPTNPFLPPTDPASPEGADVVEQSRQYAAPRLLLDQWEKYTREFIRVNQLDQGQSNAALSILKDLRSRADRIGSSNADRIKAAKALPNQAAREKKLSELNQPIEELFDELKLRLDGLLTAAQRSAARQRGS